MIWTTLFSKLKEPSWDWELGKIWSSKKILRISLFAIRKTRCIVGNFRMIPRDKHEEAIVQFQWSELCHFHKNSLFSSFIAAWVLFHLHNCLQNTLKGYSEGGNRNKQIKLVKVTKFTPLKLHYSLLRVLVFISSTTWLLSMLNCNGEKAYWCRE